MTEQEIQDKGYANPDALVSTQWVADNLDDTENFRLVESDEDVLLYDIGHVPNAVKIDWVEDLNDPLMRDYLDPEHFANLMAEKGISPDTTVIFYGDRNNWWATYALWVFRLFGHDNVKVMDGGRVKWEAEDAYFAWRLHGGASLYAVYRAAQDREDAAQDALAEG